MYSQESFTNNLLPLAKYRVLVFSQPPKILPLAGTKHKMQEPMTKLYIQTQTGSHCGFCSDSLNCAKPMGTSKPSSIAITENT